MHNDAYIKKSYLILNPNYPHQIFIIYYFYLLFLY